MLRVPGDSSIALSTSVNQYDAFNCIIDNLELIEGTSVTMQYCAAALTRLTIEVTADITPGVL